MVEVLQKSLQLSRFQAVFLLPRGSFPGSHVCRTPSQPLNTQQRARFNRQNNR